MRLRAQATVNKPEDRIAEIIDDGGTIYSVRSPSGIGNATIHQGSWPDWSSLRLYLRGLEGLSISNGSVTIKASVLSHSGNRRLACVVDEGQEKAVDEGSLYWTEIKAFDAKGRLLQGLPEAGGA
jgi:hypothetical protein